MALRNDRGKPICCRSSKQESDIRSNDSCASQHARNHYDTPLFDRAASLGANEVEIMFVSPQPIVIRSRQSDRLIDSPELRMSLEQTMLALEAEVEALQELVCYLLEKNERLRMRCKGLESDFPAGSRYYAAHTESIGILQTISAE